MFENLEKPLAGGGHDEKVLCEKYVSHGAWCTTHHNQLIEGKDCNCLEFLKIFRN